MCCNGAPKLRANFTIVCCFSTLFGALPCASGDGDPKGQEFNFPLPWLGVAVLAYMAWNSLSVGGGQNAHEITFQEFKTKLLAHVGYCVCVCRGGDHSASPTVDMFEVCCTTPRLADSTIIQYA